MYKLRLLVTAIILSGVLFTLPALAAPQSQKLDDFLSQLAAQAGPEPELATDRTTKDKGSQTEATCSADCQGAGTASCTGSTCTAVNRNCNVGQRGYATCGSITVYCDPCPVQFCDPGVSCTSGTYQPCGIDGFCKSGRCVCK